MSIELGEKLNSANTCFVCGPENPSGLQLTFALEGEYCVATFTPSALHCGYAGVTHGGIIFSALDDVMANWLYLRGIEAVTAKCDLRYKDPLPTGVSVALKGWCIKQKGRVAVMASSMSRTDNDGLIAQCEATFMLRT
jgi:acyl-coenzyme A thioesterase PaaI-like protein